MYYYKATRPDGTDFYTGLVDYAGHLGSGEPLPMLTNRGGMYRCCTDTVYHASDTPSETLIGGDWPCRLFEVTGTPVAQEGHKFGFRTMQVIREIDAWQAFGPNGIEVAELIEAARSMTHDQVLAFFRTVRPAPLSAAMDAARETAWNMAEDHGRDAAMDTAQNAARYPGHNWDEFYGEPRAAARAAMALVVRDLISADKFETLYGPWKSMFGSEGK